MYYRTAKLIFKLCGHTQEASLVRHLRTWRIARSQVCAGREAHQPGCAARSDCSLVGRVLNWRSMAGVDTLRTLGSGSLGRSRGHPIGRSRLSWDSHEGWHRADLVEKTPYALLPPLPSRMCGARKELRARSRNNVKPSALRAKRMTARQCPIRVPRKGSRAWHRTSATWSTLGGSPTPRPGVTERAHVAWHKQEETYGCRDARFTLNLHGTATA